MANVKKGDNKAVKTENTKDVNTIIEVDLGKQAQEILKRAQEKGVEHTFLFTTTFKRYQEHILHLIELQKIIKDKGMLVEKVYVKGRENLYVNPAINAYNSTSAAADKTAQLLIRYIVAPVKDEDAEGGDAFDIF